MDHTMGGILNQQARELEASGRFLSEYQRCNNRAASRRTVIGKFQFKSSPHYPTTEDREQLRRHLDKFLNMPEAVHDTLGSAHDLSHLVTIDLSDRSKPERKYTMNPPIEITTKVLVNGVEISSMDDTAIYSLIAGHEREIDQLDKINNKPKRLMDEIARRKYGLAMLVGILGQPDPLNREKL